MTGRSSCIASLSDWRRNKKTARYENRAVFYGACTLFGHMNTLAPWFELCRTFITGQLVLLHRTRQVDDHAYIVLTLLALEGEQLFIADVEHLQRAAGSTTPQCRIGFAQLVQASIEAFQLIGFPFDRIFLEEF